MNKKKKAGTGEVRLLPFHAPGPRRHSHVHAHTQLYWIERLLSKNGPQSQWVQSYAQSNLKYLKVKLPLTLTNQSNLLTRCLLPMIWKRNAEKARRRN